MKRARNFLLQLVSPRSSHEDTRRREFILNILLLGCLTLLGFAIVLEVVSSLLADKTAYANDSLGVLVICGIFVFFLALYALSRRGYVRPVSYVVVGSVFLLPAYMGYRWGIDVPVALVFYPLVIVMGGVLINTRFAFVVTIAIVMVMSLTGYLELSGIVVVNSYWKKEMWTITDVIMILLVYGITVTVSWLSNREIEHSLARAQQSEADLKLERDNLEIRVQERTEELRKAEMEKMSQAYQFVEFGRLASSLFHDITNPLTALSLNIESIANSKVEEPAALAQLADEVHLAQRATAHIQKLVESLRRHIAREGIEELFSIKNCLEETVHVLGSYARQKGAILSLDVSTEVYTYGNPVAFTQVLTNIISNAVESGAKSIAVSAEDKKGEVQICIKDTGSGIASDVLPLIFDPFFSTKNTTGGLGIGLSFAKRIIEKDFGGRIVVQSTLDTGSTFTIYFAVREP